MNRPEPIELENNLGPDAVTGEINRVPWHAYDQDEMDLYLAEKDKEIAKLESAYRDCVFERDTNQAVIYELRKEIESLKASHYAEMVDAGMRERRLSRALWLAHAYKVKFKRWWLHLALDCEASAIRPDIKTIKRIRGKIGNCEKSERKCRAMADKYGEGK